MKKVLIITYHFPPSEAIGSRRPWGLAKYLPQYGWQPIILTPEHNGRYIPEMSIVETKNYDIPYMIKKKFAVEQNKIKSIDGQKKCFGDMIKLPFFNRFNINNKLMISIFNMLEFPADKIGWYIPAYMSASDIIGKKGISAIISSALPFTSHLIAYSLKNKLDIPWIAEFRDPWAQSHYRKRGKSRYLFDQILEYYIIRSADAIVSVSPSCINTLRKLHRHKMMYVIHNGYDPDEIIESEIKYCIPQPYKFTITYTGTLWQGKRDPEVLFSAIKTLSERGLVNLGDIEINLYCPCEDWIRKEIAYYGFDSIVNLMGIVPRNVALNAQRSTTILLHLSWDNPQDAGSISGKIFEYINAKRPILAFGNSGSDIKLILEHTKTGEFVSSIKDLEFIVLKYYAEYKETGSVNFCGDREASNQYSYEKMAQKYTDLLDSIIYKCLNI